MKESKAWRILAEEHDAGRTKSDYLCVNLKWPISWGNKALAKITQDMRSAMVQRIEDAMGGDNGSAYCAGNEDSCTSDEEARQSRVLACLMFAEQSADEERAK